MDRAGGSYRLTTTRRRLLTAASAVGLSAAVMPAGRLFAAESSTDPREASLRSRFGLEGAEVGYVLFDLSNGELLLSAEPDRTFVPASTAKIATMAAALARFGADHRFETRLVATRPPDGSGRLSGDLVLVGGGDPFLDGDGLAALALEATRSVKQLDGRFLVDDGPLPQFDRIDPTQPLASTYNGAVSGLSVNFNRIRIRWRKTAGGLSAEAETVAAETIIPVSGIAFRPAPDGTPAVMPFLEDESEGGWLLSPALPDEGEAFLPVRDPAIVAGQAFAALAAAQGLRLPTVERAQAGDASTVVASLKSRPLADIARGILAYSNNPSAELVGLDHALALGQSPGTLSESAALVVEWLKSMGPATAWDGFTLANHSGLSAASRTTPRQMAAVIAIAASGPAPILDLLPEMRWSQGPGAVPNGTVRAKTGTMAFARGLAGTITTATGRRLGFAIHVGDAGRREAHDRDADPRRLYLPASARDWIDRAVAFEREMVAGWT